MSELGPLQAGGRRVEWSPYGDSNPGPVAEKRSRRLRRSPVALVLLGFLR